MNLENNERPDALYLAVLPFYRQECMRLVRSNSIKSIRVFSGRRHVDPTITTGIDRSLFTAVRNTVVAQRFLIQTGNWMPALRAGSLVVDLNPRSATAWLLLLARRAIGRRTLVWGHLYPRAGSASRTAFLRRTMRRVASGTVLYGYDSVPLALSDLPKSRVWVAPNSLYLKTDMDGVASPGPYESVLYVGRLVPEKKVDVLIDAFAGSQLRHMGVKLMIVGEGSAEQHLRNLVAENGLQDSVVFLGHEADVTVLRKLYESAICSVSPGYVGLSLTQSLGFGVPMVVSRDEPHSPELELTRFGGVTFFDTDDSASLARALDSMPRHGAQHERSRLRADVGLAYSAEAMASGLLLALSGDKQDLGPDGWPVK